MKIGIHGKEFSREEFPLIQSILQLLKDRGVEIKVSEKFSGYLQKAGLLDSYKVYDCLRKDKDLEFIFSVGGDGTLLDTLVHIGDNEIPILGVNTGRLGYLATTSKENVIPEIEALLNHEYVIDERILIHLDSDLDIFEDSTFALNDFTILKKDSSSMIVVDTYVDGEFLNKYWADGLIVSTPTGSTGYSLSCGGPLVLPQSRNFIITPVAPHNLTVRPLVLPDTKEITFKIDSRSKQVLVSLDSRSQTVDSGIILKVRKEKFVAKLIKFRDYSNFDTLRQKLNWGLDNRN